MTFEVAAEVSEESAATERDGVLTEPVPESVVRETVTDEGTEYEAALVPETAKLYVAELTAEVPEVEVNVK